MGEALAKGEGGFFILEVQTQNGVVIMSGMNGEHEDPSLEERNWASLAARIKAWGRALGFDEVGIADGQLDKAEAGLEAWLAAGFHGQMDYMHKHGAKRARPAELLPGTRRIISVRMNYLSSAEDAEAVLADSGRAYVSRYALGRDYHKVVRGRLQSLAERISAAVPHDYRVFTDSAPVMEVALAEKAGLGWRGKHSLLLSRASGSFFFLGEIYTTLPLPVDVSVESHCGNCSACLEACPTGAIVAPYQVDARRCISYLTIELKDSIPVPLRPLLGNRIYGCDDCQLVCPWNRFARISPVPDFAVRNGLDGAGLAELFAWTEDQFNRRLEGSPIRRIGFERWSRNIAVALGNADPRQTSVREGLESRLHDPSALVREHVEWALQRHRAPLTQAAV